MAAERRGLRARGKSDPIDALAIARAALREPDLPVAEHHPTSLAVKLTVDHRDDLLADRTRQINRLRWHLHQLTPDLDLPARSLHTPAQLGRVRARLADLASPNPAPTTTPTTTPTTDPTRIRIGICAELADRITELTERIAELNRDLAKHAQRLTPALLASYGCGPLTAAKLLGETANPTRFRSEACFAMHTGAAPIPASSGQTQRHRLNRGGNRQLNACLHRIALTQIRHPSPGQAYYRRRLAAGDTKREAIRALKRRIARRVYHLLVTDHRTTTQPQPAAA